MYNFAFGSNLNADKVKSRSMRPVQTLRGVLTGWRLLFNHNGGYGNIETDDLCASMSYDLSRLNKPPNEVHGVLLKFSRQEFAQLAWEEYAYDTVEVPVAVYAADRKGTGAIQPALAFKTNSCALVSTTTMPSLRYIALIAEGARAAGIDAPYCEWLDRVRNACRA